MDLGFRALRNRRGPVGQAMRSGDPQAADDRGDEGLRRPARATVGAGAGRRRPPRRGGRAGLAGGGVGVRQVDAAGHRRRPGRRHRRGGAGRRSPRHRARARPGAGLPGLLALPLAHGGGERGLRPGAEGAAQGRHRRAGGPVPVGDGSVRLRRVAARGSCRAACSSGWPSPGPWPRSRRCCSSTSPSARWTRRPGRRCATSWCRCRPTPAPPSSWSPTTWRRRCTCRAGSTCCRRGRDGWRPSWRSPSGRAGSGRCCGTRRSGSCAGASTTCWRAAPLAAAS